MSIEHNQSQEVDLDRTDVLPILEGITFDPDVEDDAVRLDQTAILSAVPIARSAFVDFPRSSAVDLPSLAESVRSVEERIARQSAEYESLVHSYEKSQEAEAAAFTRATVLTAELTTARAALEAEQTRARDLEKALADRAAAAEAAQARTAEMARKAEQHKDESLALRESLAARDANVEQILHSLSERDAQLSTLQREHARLVPELEAINSNKAQLEAELKAARTHAQALALEIKTKESTVAAMSAKTKAAELELGSAKLQLESTVQRESSFLERLRTRDWRLGFDLNVFRELDADVGAAQSSANALRGERDQLSRQVATLESKLAAHQASIDRMEEAAADNAADIEGFKQQIERHDAERAQLNAQIEALKAELKLLGSEVSARDTAIADLKAMNAAEVQQLRETVASEHAKRVEVSARVGQLETEAQSREQGMAVLMAHLAEARKPLDPLEAEIKRLADELAVKSLLVEKLTEESRDLRGNLDRTRGALEEREFLIRRLERSESTNAAVLGRIQTSIERLGTASAGASAAPTVDYTAELVRIDGEHSFRHALTRRTRIGRATTCELQIESSSVSRQHALILLGRREVIIEDLNSTNGVMVNGRKISRQMLNDGDLVLIGDIKFRLALKQPLNLPETPPELPNAG